MHIYVKHTKTNLQSNFIETVVLFYVTLVTQLYGVVQEAF